MDEDEAIAKITLLLEKGGTMLAQHHSCGAPLFRYRGAIVCPVCSFDEAGEKVQVEEQRKMPESDERPGDVNSAAVSLEYPSFEISIQEPGSSTGEGAEEPFEGMAKGLVSGDTEEVGTAVAPPSRAEPRKGSFDSHSPKSGRGRSVAVVEELVRETLVYKIEELAEALRSEQDLSKLKAQIECIEMALKVLRS